MSQTATSSDDAAYLLVALEQNEFDIAGLADFCAEQRCVDQCLRQLFQIIERHREPNAADKKLLAQVLVGMLYVARNDYAADGHQEYWPFLFGRIREAAFADPEKFWNETLSGQQYQALLGRWFLVALEAFGYSIPSEGQKYVGPVVFHAGMPASSLPRVMSVIATACDRFGPQAISLPADIRSGLVVNHFLHRNVERLLSSNLQGAAQLWGCLARVVLAWKTLGDCSDELQQLPLALDPDEVRAALPSESETPRIARAALPQLRYDPETGEIRLTFPGDGLTDWKVSSDRRPIELTWTRTHLGKTAEFNGPLPGKILIEPTNTCDAVGRVFSPYPADWPGYWFHAQNGHLEDGQTIDASGIGSGRWYVVFKGTPTKCSVPFIGRVQLKWSWYTGNQDWTAWEIEVPPRTATQTHIEWFVDTNCFRVPLSRRPGPRVELIESPVVNASTPDGNHLDVFGATPSVILRRDVPLSVCLLRETQDSVAILKRLDLKPETVTALPVTEPGIYQLRESRGVGRTLLRFAIVPGLQIQGPDLSEDLLSASLRIIADNSAGQICEGDTGTTRTGNQWVIQLSTVEPVLKSRWCWTSVEITPLSFRWPLESLRWRVIGAGDQYTGWTRQAVFINPGTVAKHDAQLEIQIPVGSELYVNGECYTGRRQPSPSGDIIVLSLLAYPEIVELTFADQRYAVVVKTERPLIDEFSGIADCRHVFLTLKGSGNTTGLAVVAWDPCSFLSSSKTYSLSDAEVTCGERTIDCDGLPGEEWTAVSLARAAGGFFQKSIHLAVKQSQDMEPVSLLLNRVTGEMTQLTGTPRSWVEFLYNLSLSRFLNKDLESSEVEKLLQELARAGQAPFSGLLRLVKQLKEFLQATTLNERDRRWADSLHEVVLRVMTQSARTCPIADLSLEDTDRCLKELCEIGISIGQQFPTRWVEKSESLPGSCVYPLAYIRDLWLLGTIPEVLAFGLNSVGGQLPPDFCNMQVDAATRVLQFHRDNELPSISYFLPIGQSVATTRQTSAGHVHSFALPPLGKSVESEGELCRLLGFSDGGRTCQATTEDPFFDTHRKKRSAIQQSAGSPGRTNGQLHDYSLSWSADAHQWIFKRQTLAGKSCCSSKGLPLLVLPIKPTVLAESPVRECLNQWARNECLNSEHQLDFEFLHTLRVHMLQDDVSGKLHGELFKPSEFENRQLHGNNVRVKIRNGLPDVAMVAWQLAWIERMVAWGETQRVLGVLGPVTQLRRQCLSAFGRALEIWPRLMCRCIALAELIYWTLYRGGLGVSARYRSQQTDKDLVILTKLAASRQNAFALDSGDVPSTGTPSSIVPGVIIGYHGGQGIILLKKAEGESLHAVVSRYLAQGKIEAEWTTRFEWGDFPPSLQTEFLEQVRKLSERERPSEALAKFLCGMQVHCTLTGPDRTTVNRVEKTPRVQKLDIPANRHCDITAQDQ